ncbi:MAG: rRNA maturation RNAse YbeY [Candidatus Moduliflexus flocculans]|nr:rRNA maturation RNAse YbeY [Candidatus Moduliflexus flocculans]
MSACSRTSAGSYRLADPEVTLAFVGDRAIQTLNRKFMKKDRPTDVLSFPLGREGPGRQVLPGRHRHRRAGRRPPGPGEGPRASTASCACSPSTAISTFSGFDHFAGIEEEERKAHGLYLA